MTQEPHPLRCETCDFFPAGSIFDSRCPYSEFSWRHAGNHPQCIKNPFLASDIWQIPIDVISELTSFIGCASHSSAASGLDRVLDELADFCVKRERGVEAIRRGLYLDVLQKIVELRKQGEQR